MFWFIFCKTDLLITQQPDGTWSVPAGDKPPVELKAWHTVHNVAPVAGINESVKAVLTDHPPTSLLSPNKQTVSSPNDQTASSAPHKEGQERSPYEMCPLRQSYYKLPYALYLMAGKCQEILYWDSNTKFCGVCGAPMKLHTDISKRCTNCGKEVWPQLATAVIVLVRRKPEHEGDEERALLVHARNFRSDFYGLVAGFVETGETLEQAVHREVMEETGITISNLRYFGSQPWPYPCGLMVGFRADYAGGTIHLQREELSRGAWFTKSHLPHIPEKLSIARQLIDNWLEEPNTPSKDKEKDL